MRPCPTLVLWLVGVLGFTARAEDLTYQRPPPAVARFVEARPTPVVIPGPDRRTVLLATPRPFPSIAELAEPELRLAGLRLNPKSRTRSRRTSMQALELLDVRAATATPRPITGLPANARIFEVSWSPDGTRVAFNVALDDGLTAWVADVKTAVASRVSPAHLNALFGSPCRWLADSKALVCLVVPEGQLPPPAPSNVPTGPVVQENDGTRKPHRTNPNLLTTPNDALQFEFYGSSQVAVLGLDGTRRNVGTPALVLEATPSPGGAFLLVSSTHRPFSYQVALERFPVRTEVWQLDGTLVSTLADLPLAEEVPVDFDAVRTGRREFMWRADVGATVCWVEAKDGGDPRRAASIRDELSCLAAPFTGTPTVVATLKTRYQKANWSSDRLALVTEFWWKDRTLRTWAVAPGVSGTAPRLLWERSSEDRYHDPGQPLLTRTPAGKEVLQLTSKGHLLLTGDGASAEGDRPFLDRVDPATGKAERLFRSEGAQVARVKAVLDDDGREVLMTRETVSTPPNLFLSVSGKEQQLTRFVHPVPELVGVTKQLIRWSRPDGQKLSGMLYLPAGFRPGTDAPLPVLVWVYPSEFKSAANAGQVQGSPYEFATPWLDGPLFSLPQGFAVVDDPSFAIVGEGKAEPNDTYVEQLCADAASLVDELVRLKVGDRDRMAVGGHSYGAFTTANLLAHSDLFRAGIARSGAYNRTLTPFGFQSEERSFWEAPETYLRMSPFRYAGDINEPLLLIHGAADDNAGTYPIQSERLFAAMQGLGGTVRYVSLPVEAHGYRARESVLHVLWEQVRWLEQHVKQAPRRAAPSTDGGR